ncbi:MAG: universal stress protein [Halobacteriota archaeon]
MYDNILVPTDGSPSAFAAVEHALELATAFDARLHVLYVVDVNVYSTLEAGEEVVLENLRTQGRAAVEEVAEAAEAEGVEVVTEVLTSTPYRGIVDYVGDNDIDLVVMGTHGRRGIQRYLLGSVTEKVVRTAPVPVLTVRESDEEEDA